MQACLSVSHCRGQPRVDGVSHLSGTISWGDNPKTNSETTQLGLKAAAEAARQRLPSIADGDAGRKYIPSLAHRRQTRLYRAVPPVFACPAASLGCAMTSQSATSTQQAERLALTMTRAE